MYIQTQNYQERKFSKLLAVSQATARFHQKTRSKKDHFEGESGCLKTRKGHI